jgi:cytochrome c556
MRIDHAQVLGSCSSCHNGLIAIGKPPQHVVTTAECDSCHNTVTWQ